ncbi:Glucan endo-1,3-alpha-glucosidase agn1 [Sphaceloma murrayae]|uniref:Glucan endo-1,3-alpha-glucosidase agn1 n=1 Tax=Sphaceloma murrayae TaxID=2082308 RepID=A0A2K1QYL7_9PEZI|nr:Glucan endo-1,3-alpha-glucosidase agn1 [Sphaceloma murrayae]
MASAKQMNLDGFALNWTPPDCQQPYLRWMPTQIDNAYKAAEEEGFVLTHSFDMSYSICDYFWNTTYMTSTLVRHATSPSSLKWNDKIVVTTFGGDTVPDKYDNGFFQDLKDKMNDLGHPIVLVPAFNQFSERAQAGDRSREAGGLLSAFPSIDGFFNWQAWPQTKQNLTTQVDDSFRSALTSAQKSGPYIMG